MSTFVAAHDDEVNLKANSEYRLKETELENALQMHNLANFRAKQKLKTTLHAKGIDLHKVAAHAGHRNSLRRASSVDVTDPISSDLVAAPALVTAPIAAAPALAEPPVEAAAEPPTPAVPEEKPEPVTVPKTAPSLMKRLSSGVASAASGVASTLGLKSAAPSGPGEEIVLDDIGYMALRKLVIERGVPEKVAKNTPGKGALVALAEKHGCNLMFK